jgi:Family of unknown function (DUF5670)
VVQRVIRLHWIGIFFDDKQRHSASSRSHVDVTRALCAIPSSKVAGMFLILAIVLFLLWIGGFVMFKSAGILIHLLVIFAVISLVLHLITGRRS